MTAAGYSSARPTVISSLSTPAALAGVATLAALAAAMAAASALSSRDGHPVHRRVTALPWERPGGRAAMVHARIYSASILAAAAGRRDVAVSGA
jgi:hypothetical protein